MISIPSTFLACILGAVVANFMGKDLKDDPVFQERLAKGQVNMVASSDEQKVIPPEAKRSVLIFGICLFCVVFYAMAISSTFALIEKPILSRDDAIISFMLGAATLISLFCKVDAKNILNAATFKSGMSACICVLGVAWLGTTFVTAHMKEINVFAGNLLASYPWMLAVVLFFAAMLLYSQAATTKALMPAALALGVSPVAATAPNIIAIARPWKMGSKSITKEPTTTAAAVRAIGLNRTAPAFISAFLSPPQSRHSIWAKSISRIEFLTMMPASAIKPIMEVAVKKAPNSQWPGSIPTRVRGMGAIMIRGVTKFLNQATTRI